MARYHITKTGVINRCLALPGECTEVPFGDYPNWKLASNDFAKAVKENPSKMRALNFSS
jgi:hypothetical protein